MLSREDLKRIQEGIKILEIDGLDGISTASNILGIEGAIAVLIAITRVELGSKKTYPPDLRIDDKITALLIKQRLVHR